jgi:hypothetical protein
MFNFLISIFSHKILSVAEIEVLSTPRSPQWKKIRDQHLKQSPTCAVCGSSKNVVPHHIMPFHLEPEKELDLKNLISLCENKNFNCHFFFGHYKNWCKYNPNIVEDAKIWNNKLNLQ